MTDIVERLRAWGTGYSVHKEAAHEIEKLRAALVKAIDCVQFWASYASEYAQDKHDLADDLRDLRAALGEKE